MNLADANLKHVNTSRPQLIHSTSKQSVTASDDYYSLTSDTSSGEEKGNGPRYETPPLHVRPQNPGQQAPQSEATIQSIRPVKHTQQGSESSEEKPQITPRNPEHRIKRKPVSSQSSQGTIRERPLSQESAPTPGVDNTPYVRYAIDSLTRDERSYYGGTHLEEERPIHTPAAPEITHQDEVSVLSTSPAPSSRHSRISREYRSTELTHGADLA